MGYSDPIRFDTPKAKNIIHIFDPPNLLKEIRNCFMYYQFWFKMNGTECTGWWREIEMWYDIIDDHDVIRMYANKIFLKSEDLQRTSYAAKILSNTMQQNLYEMSSDSSKYLLCRTIEIC